MELRLGFMASHNGSNIKAILENIKTKSLEAKAKIVISNNPNAGVLKIAKERNIPAYCINSKNIPQGFGSTENFITKIMNLHEVNLVILAGYMKPVKKEMLEIYPNRILNIHPSLLPKYGGKGMYGSSVHEAVINSKDKESGATVHLVTPEYDEGKILAQCKIPRYEKDTPKILAERVLEFEHVLYSQVLKDIQEEIINLDE